MRLDGVRRYGALIDDGWSREGARSALDRRELCRPTRGVYSGAPVEAGDLRPLFLRLPPSAMLSSISAAEAFGWPVPPAPSSEACRRVHVVVPAGVAVPRIRGVVAREAVLRVPDPVLIGGVPCVPPARCAVDLARQLRRLDALPVLDGALRSGLCLPGDLLAEVAAHDGLRGVRQARDLIAVADGRAECAQESQLRLVLLDGGLPVPEPQVWVAEDGIALYRMDLAYEARRIGIEYDGVTHLTRDQLRHDRARLNWLADHGWQMRLFTDRDLYRRPAYIVTTVRALLPPRR